MIEIRHYLDRVGRDVFDAWFANLSDRRTQAKVATRTTGWPPEISAIAGP